MSLHRLRPLPVLEGCRLWLVDLDAPASPGEFDSLSADEIARAGRFAFARHRARFLAGRAALRRLLGERIGRPAARLPLGYGPHGKPVLQGMPAPAFNLSHSEGLGLLALAEDDEHPPAAIGVDIEVLRPLSDAPALAAANFEAAERAALEHLDEPARSRAFLIGWTRKEACLKAVGSGFSAPAVLATGLGLEARLLAWRDGASPAMHHASVRSFELAEGGAVASLARLRAPPATAAAAACAAALSS